MKPVKMGIVGCGNISGIYFKNAKFFESTELVACADLVPERAEARAEEFGAEARGVKDLLADPDIEMVLNLTIPNAHAEVALAALEAGKSVYNEKPLAVTREDAQRLLDAARRRGLRVGCAPDTFLGAGLQTCRKLIDDGCIGEPVAATAFMQCHGHENWHPDPEFYYKPGGGPMFDMGPYYLTTLIALFGPIRRVSGSARVTFPERLVTSEPKSGARIAVETPTHIAGVMDFACGAVGCIVMSFDVWAHHLPCLEVHGTEGSMSVPDPNGFGGPVRVRRSASKEWEEIPHTHGYGEHFRGIGPADMAYALRSGRPHRASGEMAYHVLDVMQAFLDSSDTGRHIEVRSACQRPAALPTDLRPGVLDA